MILGTLILALNSYAQTKLEYYKVLLEGFGVAAYTETTDFLSIQDQFSSKSDFEYLILLASDITDTKDMKTYLENNKKIILICDKSYSNTNPVSFECDKSYAKQSETDNADYLLNAIDSQSESLFVMPENYLVSPEKRVEISNYLKAIKRSETVTNSFEDIKYINDKTSVVDVTKSIMSYTTFRVFGIAVSTLFLAYISYGLLKYLISLDRNKFATVSFREIPMRIGKFFNSHRWVFSYSIILILIGYIPVIIYLCAKNEGVGGIRYFAVLFKDSFNINNLVNFIGQSNYFRAAFFFYNFIFLSILVVLFIPYFIKITLIISSKITREVLKPEIHRYATSSLLILAILISSFYKISELLIPLLIIFVILFYIILNNIRYKSFEYSYSVREKIIFISISFLIILGGIFTKLGESRIGNVYKKEDLIGIKDTVVTTPYSKQLGNNVIFNSERVNFPVPIFVNQYLVYSPTYLRVENRNISEFRDGHPYYIQNGKFEDIIPVLYSNKQVSEILESDSPSNFFRVKNFEKNFEKDEVNIQITFSCERENLGVDEIKSRFYFASADGSLKSSDQVLLYFPGCIKKGEPEVFTVEFVPPHTETEYFFVRLPDVLPSDLKNIKIIGPSEVIDPVYFINSVGYNILASGGLIDFFEPTVTNYIFGDAYSLSFDMNFDYDGKFDITEPINQLVKEGVLKNNFLIWSTKDLISIRSD